MMKWGWVFVRAFLILGLLAACAEGEEIVVESTAVPTAPPTLEPTATETAVAVSVLAETAVTTLAPPTESPTPPSSLSDVIDFHQLVEVPLGTSVDYSLKTPDYDFLRDWLRAARETPERSLPYFYIFDLLAFDFARSFPNGAGQIESVFQEARVGSYLDERLTWPVLETAVVAYLNQYQIALEDGNAVHRLNFTLESHLTDLKSNEANIWFVEVEAKDLRILGVLPLFIEQNGQYTILPHMIEPVNTSLYHLATQQSFDYDFTGDGQVDVFQAAEGYAGGPIAFISVYTWDGSTLSLLEKINTSVPTYKPYAIYDIGDFTSDGVTDVKVTTPHEVNFNCIWDEEDIYSWNGRTPQHLLMEETQMPDTPECAMFHAITPRNYYSEAVLAEKSRIELLESALGHLTLETVPSADYLALGYLHLAMAYLEQNDVNKAQQTFDQLYNLPEDASFAQLVKEFYSESRGDLLAVCQRLYTSPELADETSVRDYIHEGSVTGFNGIGSEVLNPDAICPYPQLITTRLEALSLPTNQHPATSLSQLGYTFSQYDSFNLDLDASLEWLGIVKKEEAYLVLFDEIDGVLRPVILSNICLDCEDNLIYELRQDEQGAHIVGRLSSYQVMCMLTYELIVHNSPFLVRSTENGFEIDMIGTYCSANVDERPLAEISAADFDPDPPRLPTWRSLLNEATGQDEWEWMRDVQTAVLTQTDPAIPEKITQLLNYLPADDPDAQPYIEHLTYLLGYFYELNGEEENAVDTYLDLIQRYPTSPWSWLAWARLEPVE